MFIVHVDVHVVADQLRAFLSATEVNALASRTEAGVLRFDVISDLADPNHVVLVEVYRDEAAAGAHKETDHYATWRDLVAPMMATPRTGVKFSAITPTQPSQWATPSA